MNRQDRVLANIAEARRLAGDVGIRNALDSLVWGIESARLGGDVIAGLSGFSPMMLHDLAARCVAPTIDESYRKFREWFYATSVDANDASLDELEAASEILDRNTR